jgi:hypothetical protein
MNNIVPICGTSINWPEYVKAAERMLGRSPTRSLDSSGVAVGSPASFLASIGEFKNAGTNPHQFIENYTPEENHLHFGFLCQLDNDTFIELILAVSSRLMITQCRDAKKRTFIISGLLSDWRLCLSKPNEELQLFYNDIILIFDRFGFHNYFTRGSHGTSSISGS